jgi:hypothetical protein
MRSHTTLISLTLAFAFAVLSAGCQHHQATAAAAQSAPVSLSLYQGDSAGQILLAPGAPQTPALTSTSGEAEELFD